MEESREDLIHSLEAEDRALYELHKQHHCSLRRHSYVDTHQDSRMDYDLAAVRTVRSILRLRDAGEMPMVFSNAVEGPHVPHGAMPSKAAQCITPTGSYGHLPSRKGTIQPVVVNSPEVPRPSLTLASCSDAASDTSYPPAYETETKGSRTDLLEDLVDATSPTSLGALTILPSVLPNGSGKGTEACCRRSMSATISPREDVSGRSAYTAASPLEGTISHLDDDDVVSEAFIPDSPQSYVSSQLLSDRTYTLDGSPEFDEVDPSNSSKVSSNGARTVEVSTENVDVGERITFDHRAVSRAEGTTLVTHPFPSADNPQSAYATSEADVLSDDKKSTLNWMPHTEDAADEAGGVEDYAAVGVDGAANSLATNGCIEAPNAATSFGNEVPMMTFMTDVDIGGLTPMESDRASAAGDVSWRGSNVFDNVTPIQSHFESFDARMPMYSNMESKTSDLSEPSYSDSSHTTVIEPPLLSSTAQQPGNVTSTVSTIGVSTNAPDESPISKVGLSTVPSSPTTTTTTTGNTEANASTTLGITVTHVMAVPDEGAGATFTEHPLSDTVAQSPSISDTDLKTVEASSLQDEFPVNSVDGSTSSTAVVVSDVETANSISVNDASSTGELTTFSTVDTERSNSNVTFIAADNICPDITSAGTAYPNSVDSQLSPGVQPPEDQNVDLSIANDAPIDPSDNSIHNDDDKTQGDVGVVEAICIKSSSISPLSEEASSTVDTMDIRSVSRAFSLSGMGDSSGPSTSCPPDKHHIAKYPSVDFSGEASIDSTIAKSETTDATSSDVVAPTRSESILESPKEVPIDGDISHDLNSDDAFPTRGDASLGKACRSVAFSDPGDRSSEASSEVATAVERFHLEEMAEPQFVMVKTVSQSVSSIPPLFEEISPVDGLHDAEAAVETAPLSVYEAESQSAETVPVDDNVLPANGFPTLTMIPSSPEEDGCGMDIPSAHSSTDFAADSPCSENLGNTVTPTDIVPSEQPCSMSNDAPSGTPSSYSSADEESISSATASEDAFSTGEECVGTPIYADQTPLTTTVNSVINGRMTVTYANSLAKEAGSTSSVSSFDSFSEVANEDVEEVESRSSSSDSDNPGASASTWNDVADADTPDPVVGGSINSMSSEETSVDAVDGATQPEGVSAYASYFMNFF